MKKVILFAVATALFFGCSGDSNPIQETQSAQDTFRKHSGYLHDVEFRAAVRNSWVGTTETTETHFVFQNEQVESIPICQGPVSDGLMDVGKEITGDLFKKGLSYAIDSAFGIQSKSQKEADETTFINHTLLGIQHQLTQINTNLTNVYTNQTQAMSTASINNLNYLKDFSQTETLIVQDSGNWQKFNNLYPSFIKDIENATSGSDWTVSYDQVCGSSTSPTAFIATYYNDLKTDGTDDEATILAYAYDVLNDLFGSSQISFFSDQVENAQSYMNHLLGDPSANNPIPPATGINLVSNYYAAGTTASQLAYGVANILQKCYTVLAFTLQLAVNSNCACGETTLLDYLNTADVFPVSEIYENIELSTLTSNTLPKALDTLSTNFTNSFLNNAKTDIDNVMKALITFDKTTESYWDTAALLTYAGLSLDTNFMQSGCFPLSYVKNVNTNGNLDYLAAECNYNGNWKVLQLYIPTNNGEPGMTNISYLNDFGLIGNFDSDVFSLSPSANVVTAGSTSDHYKDLCGNGFSDCFVAQTSVALTAEPLYGAGYLFDGNWNSNPCGFNPNPLGLNTRYTFNMNCTSDNGGDNNATANNYTFQITPNGHVFQTSIVCNYTYAHSLELLENWQFEFGVGTITEKNTSLSDGTLTWSTDKPKAQQTQIQVTTEPSNNTQCQNGNMNCGGGYAEYGFGIQKIINAPQPDAEPYPLCSVNSPVSLMPLYSYTNSGVLTGTVTDATTITDSNKDTLTFASTYDSFTYKSNTWSRSTSSTTPPDGAESIQGVWQTGKGSSTQYMCIYCN